MALPRAVGALDIVGTEYTFDLQATDAAGRPVDLAGGDALPSGWTHVSFHNEGEEAHQVMFARLQEGVDLAELAATEELKALRPELDGVAVMALLGIPPGRAVGEALAFLMEIRLEEGLIGEGAATERLLAWWQSRPA